MNLDSKALPIVAAALVLGVAVLLIVGKNVLQPAAPTPAGTSTAPAATPPPLHPKQVEARLAIREGRMDDARDALLSVSQTDPLYLGVLGDLAVLYESRGQFEAALTTGNQLLMLEPENSEAHHGMARAFYGLEDYRRAEMHAMRALEIDPGNARARYTVALVRLAAGQIDRAIDAYLRAMHISQDQANIDAALTDLTLLEQSRPDLAEVHYAMAFFANSLGSEEQEILELERYLAANASGAAAESARSRLAELKGAQP